MYHGKDRGGDQCEKAQPDRRSPGQNGRRDRYRRDQHQSKRIFQPAGPIQQISKLSDVEGESEGRHANGQRPAGLPYRLDDDVVQCSQRYDSKGNFEGQQEAESEMHDEQTYELPYQRYSTDRR